MKPIATALIAAGVLVSAPAVASMDLAKTNNCMVCHSVDKKLVGPSFQDVARKYAGNAAAEEELADKIKSGGRGVWGVVPMPSNPNVTDADIAILVKWILAGAQATAANLSSLAIVGARGTLAAGESLSLVAESGYSDASSKRISANWSVSNSTVATITGNGTLTAGTVTADTPVLVTASYTEGATTLSAIYHVIVQASAVAPQFTAEVIATRNAQNFTQLQLRFNAEASDVGGRRAKLFVAALLPAGPLVSQPSYFLLNRNREWQALSWPLAEYRLGVNANESQLIELINAVDTSAIAGAQFFVGYGESDTEMLNAGRYRLVYQLP